MLKFGDMKTLQKLAAIHASVHVNHRRLDDEDEVRLNHAIVVFLGLS
jgi:hypothetical protein